MLLHAPSKFRETASLAVLPASVPFLLPCWADKLMLYLNPALRLQMKIRRKRDEISDLTI